MGKVAKGKQNGTTTAKNTKKSNKKEEPVVEENKEDQQKSNENGHDDENRQETTGLLKECQSLFNTINLYEVLGVEKTASSAESKLKNLIQVMR